MPLGALGLTLSTLAFGLMGPGFAGTIAADGADRRLQRPALRAAERPVQWRAPEDRRGAVIALANMLVYARHAGAARCWPWRWPALGFSARGTFLGASVVLAAGSLWALWLVPDAFLRFLLIMLAGTLYRLRVLGRSNVPDEGPALLTPNHVSFADGLFVIAAIDRPVRFVVYAEYFQRPAPGPVPPRDAGDPDRQHRRAEDDPPGVPRGGPGARRRRARLHLPRRPDHPDRADLAVPARARADRQGPDGADHPRPPRPGDGQHLQPDAAPAAARADPAAGDGLVRHAAARRTPP